jgi:hypothetical protein
MRISPLLNCLMEEQVRRTTFTTFLTAAALAGCLATSLLAQTPTSTAVQPPTPTTMPSTATSSMPPVQSAMPTPQPGTTPPSIADSDHGTSIVLLQHIQKVLDDAVSGKSGNVSLDRAVIDELRAELTQVRLSLQVEKP